MTDKQIIIDGLSCDNCPEVKRCQEQQTKKEYAINQVLQDIPSEYANVIARLKQIIPSITRCDYVLEKQLKAKEQECEELNKQLISFMNGDYCANGCSLKQQLDQLKAENEELKKERKILDDEILVVEITEKQFEEYQKLKQTLKEIKDIMKKHCRKCKKHKFYHFKLCCTCKYTEILQKVSECEVDNG